MNKETVVWKENTFCLHSLEGEGGTKSRVRRKKDECAFTLIELLVVVLMISILVAVALPQYQYAVAKSRFASIRPFIFTLKQAQETYYLAQGEYATDMADLDIGHSCTNTGYRNIFLCNKQFLIAPLDTVSNRDMIRVYVCPSALEGRLDEAASVCVNHNKDYEYFVWLNHSNNPDKQYCSGNSSSEVGTKFCTKLCGARYCDL